MLAALATGQFLLALLCGILAAGHADNGNMGTMVFFLCLFVINLSLGIFNLTRV